MATWQDRAGRRDLHIDQAQRGSFLGICVPLFQNSTTRMNSRSPMTLSKAFRLTFLRIEGGDHRHRRVLAILQGVITGLGNKVVGMLISFLAVPLTIGYLGTERYGAWVTIGSLLAWLQLTDFGLGNGLTNAVTTAVGQDRPDLVRMHLSNGVALLISIAAAIGLLAALAWPFIDWGAVFGVSDPATVAELGPAVALALAVFLIQFPLSSGGKVYMAYQEGRIGTYWGMIGNILSLLALITVTQTGGGLVWLVVAVSGTQMLVNVVSNAWVYLHHRPNLRPGLRYVDTSAMRSLSAVGGKFFLIQIMALVTFQTDNLVISHYLGAARVPEYSLTYTLFSYTALPQSLLFGYLWTAYAEAIARKDIAWVSRTFHVSLLAGIAFTAVAVGGLAFIAQPFIAWWAGPAVIPSIALIGWMASWSMINALTNPVACLLAAASHLRWQLIYSFFATVSNLALSIYLVDTWGVTGVIAATVISYAAFVCLPILIDAELLLKKLRHAV